MKSLEDRFWPMVSRSDRGCWEWVGSKVNGYGRLNSGGRNGTSLIASRVSYELNVGPIPAGFHICHTCDNPSCVKPSHLFLGTDAANTEDKVRKERQPKGTVHWKAVLDEEKVREIRYLRSEGWALKSIARIFGISKETVSAIARRKRWGHVT
jgi:hypothetical protein